MRDTYFTLIKAPKLADLKSRQVTHEELQSALVHLIELYNEQGKAMDSAIRELLQYKEASRKRGLMNTPFDI